MKPFLTLFLLLPLLGAQQKVHNPSDKIEGQELHDYLSAQADCQNEGGGVSFSSVDQFDFLRKGYDQAVVVASTCITGTAGPDVHAVFTRDENGELKELKIEESKLKNRVLFGNPNSEYRIESGLLVETFRDTSGRDDPLVVKYKWDPAKEQFSIVSEAAAKRYKTSYDCDKAEKGKDATAQAICYVGTLADLDVELAETYRTLLKSLDAEGRKAAIEEQRKWITQRNDECDIYKWWVDCLEEKYKERIVELKEKMGAAKKPG